MWERNMAAYTVTRDSSDSSLLGTKDVWQLPASKKYRSHFEIIASILDVARNNSGDKYFLMKHTSVNYAQLKKYLGFLTRTRFIEVEMRGQRIQYCATERGLAFLKQYRILLGMLADTYAVGDQGQLVYQPTCAPTRKLNQ
jgi:predicted transcriptional regulator